MLLGGVTKYGNPLGCDMISSDLTSAWTLFNYYANEGVMLSVQHRLSAVAMGQTVPVCK